MATKKTDFSITAPTDAEVEMKENGLKVLGEKLSAKEIDRLRQIVLYEPSVLAAARKYMRL